MGEAAALIAAFTWSATSVAMAQLSVRTTPVAMSALRLSVASLLLPFVLLASGTVGELGSASALAIFSMVGSGLLAYTIGDTVYIRALSQVGIQRAFPIAMSLFILLSVAGGVLLLDEPFRWTQAAGALLTAVGISLIVRSHAQAAEGVLDAAGVATGARRQHLGPQAYVLLLIVGVTWAGATLWLAAGRGDLGAIPASAMRTPAGAVAMLTFAMVTAPADLARPFLDRRQLAGIVGVGVMGTLFGSLLYVYAVGEAGAARTTILSAASPLMALPLSVLVLKEPFTRAVAAGTAVCVAGIVLVVA